MACMSCGLHELWTFFAASLQSSLMMSLFVDDVICLLIFLLMDVARLLCSRLHISRRIRYCSPALLADL